MTVSVSQEITLFFLGTNPRASSCISQGILLEILSGNPWVSLTISS